MVPSYDLKTLWVTSVGDRRVPGSLTPIDPATGQPGAPVNVDDPYNLYFTPDGSFAIVVAEKRRRLDFRDPHTMELKFSLPVAAMRRRQPRGYSRSTAATRSSPASTTARW